VIMKTSEFESVKLAKKAAKAQLAWYEKMMQEIREIKLNMIPLPDNYMTEEAMTCFTKSYNGEGSYYCPDCNSNQGSVWLDNNFRPTKFQALCYHCRAKYIITD